MVIEGSPERQLDFEPDLWLRVTVRLHLPPTQVDGVDAEVSKVFMSWPTHTSLGSLGLHADGRAQLRYNPEQEHEGRKGGLEWSGVPMMLKDAESVAEETHASHSLGGRDRHPEQRGNDAIDIEAWRALQTGEAQRPGSK